MTMILNSIQYLPRYFCYLQPVFLVIRRIEEAEKHQIW